MIKLLKLIYINILEFADINRILISKQNNYKDNSELKIIILGIVSIICGVFLYNVYNAMFIIFQNKYNLLVLSFIVGNLVVLFSNIMNIQSVLFKGKDNDMLYSLPMAKYQIILSKLFNVYLKNLFYLFIIKFPAILVFGKEIKVTETLGFLYLLLGLILPLIPIIITTFISYYDCYYKINCKNKFIYLLIRYFIILVVFGSLSFYFKDISNLDGLIKKVSYLYPLIITFDLAIRKNNIICIIIGILIPLILTYYFVKYLSDNYIKMYSIVRGVKKNRKFDINKYKKNNKILSLIKKEFYNLLNNKNYFSQTLGRQFVYCIVFIVLCIFIKNSSFTSYKYFENIFELFFPCFLGFIASFNCTTISSLSLEGKALQVLRTFPLKMKIILFSKWLFNMIISIPLILIDAIALKFIFDTNNFMFLICIIFPILALGFVAILGLVLDYRFINLKTENEIFIIKQRMVVFVPYIVSILIAVLPFLLPLYIDSKVILIFYSFVMFLGIMTCLIYLLIKRKKLEKNLLK